MPIRFDLSQHPEMLKQTLDSVNGVLFTGGLLKTRIFNEMSKETQAFYQTATEIVKYAINRKLPLFAICQGYQLLCQIIVDIYEPKEANFEHKVRDCILQETTMWGVPLRSTVWRDSDYRKSKFFDFITEELWSIEKMQRHGHSWAIPTEKFNACSLSSFFKILAVDDGTPQGIVTDKPYSEFPIIIEAKGYPIQAWLTHPEAVLKDEYTETEGHEEELTVTHKSKVYKVLKSTAPQIEERCAFAHALSDGFIALCREYEKPSRYLNPDLHLVFRQEHKNMLKLPIPHKSIYLHAECAHSFT